MQLQNYNCHLSLLHIRFIDDLVFFFSFSDNNISTYHMYYQIYFIYVDRLVMKLEPVVKSYQTYT